MAGGIITSDSGQDFPAKLTGQVKICTIIAAFGGLTFGYDIGISGGVTGMDDFLLKFFPNVYVKKHHAHETNYCKFDDQNLQLFTSSLYLAAIIASACASVMCKKFGRKPTMQVASVFFLIGALLNVSAKNLYMLIGGRLLLGAGVGCGNQAVPLFITEIAPAKYRRGLNICFQLLITIGILIASIVNYGTSKIQDYGWRVSLGGAAVPAIILLLGSFLIVETPASLIERGKKERGLKTLRKIRGVEDVEKEFEEIVRATEIVNKINPPVICGTIIHVFQQFSGINVIMFYTPVWFQTMGLGSDASLISAVIVGVTIIWLSTLMAVAGVDKFGKKNLFVFGTMILLIVQCIVWGILETYLTKTGIVQSLIGIYVVCFICVFVFVFALSWGPLGWLISGQVFPLETPTSGFFLAVATIIIAQEYLTMLCHMQSYIYFFFAAWLVIMITLAKTTLPETKGVPIDEMVERVGKKKFYQNDDIERPKKVLSK